MRKDEEIVNCDSLSMSYCPALWLSLAFLSMMFDSKGEKEKCREKEETIKLSDLRHRRPFAVNEHRARDEKSQRSHFRSRRACECLRSFARFHLEMRKATRKRETLKLRSREVGVFSKEFTKGGRNDGLDNITYNNKRTHIGLYYIYVHAYIHMISRNSIKQ